MSVRHRSIYLVLIRVVLLFMTAVCCSFAADKWSDATPTSNLTAKSQQLVGRSDQLNIAAALAGTGPVFISDYFSFAGADEKGHVAFAIDNDRARRGGKYTADAHVVLHAEHGGWIAVSGAGSYVNKKRSCCAFPILLNSNSSETQQQE